MVIIHRQVYSMRCSFTHICTYTSLQTHCSRNKTSVHQDFRTVFTEIVKLYIQTIEQAQFKTNIQLLCNFPCYKLIGVTYRGNSIFIISPVGSKNLASTGRVHIHIRQVEKSIRITSYCIITDKTISYLQLQLICHFLYRSPKSLIREHPCTSYRREKTISFILSESFGTIVSKVEFCKITAIITIRHSTRYSLISFRQ